MVSFTKFVLTAILSASAVTAIPQTAAAQTAASTAATAAPAPPALTYLYTSFVNISAPTDYGLVPEGDRIVIPITGGNFTGPKLSGQILNLGADWGFIDVKTGIFRPDTRYGFKTSDGAYIYVRSQGLLDPVSNQLHLQLQYETGSPLYSWLNNVIAVGVGTQVVGTVVTGGVLKIDSFYF